MYLQQKACLFIDGTFIVPQVGSIGSSDFFQNPPAFGHNIRDPKGAADFDEFAA